MSRIKKGTNALKRRNYLLSRAKGYINDASKKFGKAKERLLKAESNMYISRKLRKREFRSLWITRINGALDQIGSAVSYSRFINFLSVAQITINRKSLSEMAIKDIEAFKSLVESVTPKVDAK